MALVNTLGVLVLVFFFALIVAIIVIKNKETNLPKDNVYFINFLSDYSKGYSKGYVLGKPVTKNGKTLIEFLPDDIDINFAHKIKPQKIVTYNKNILTIAKGSLSGEQTILIALPPTSNDYPVGLNGNELGEILMKKTEEKNSETMREKIYRNQVENLYKLQINYAGLDIYSNNMDIDAAINKQRAKNMAEGKDSSSSQGFNFNKNENK